MSEANKQVALDFLKAMDVGDAALMDRCIGPDAVTITKGFGQVSGWRNRETMLATTAAFGDVMPGGFRLKIGKVVAEGDTVVVEFEGNAVLSNGEPYCNQYVFIFTFEDGKIRQLNEYFCTVLADSKILPLLAAKGDELAHGN
ncbi:MAG TPA: nuclear transport factor 2 family protein [Novosphingobium sp.]